MIKNKKQKFSRLFFLGILLGIVFGIGVWIGQEKKENITESKLFNNKKITQDELKEIITLWETIDKKFVDTREDQSKKITKQDHIWGAMQGLTASYQDPYTNFLPPEINQSFQDDIKGEFSGVGMEIVNRNGFLTVVSPLPDTPAFLAGIKPKDIIIEIDGKDSLDMSSGTAVKLIRGEKNTPVVLKVLRKGEVKPLEIKVIRDVIKIPVIKTYQKNGVFIIKIYNFTENLPQKFFGGIKEFIKSKKQKLIIDVRGNPGGHLFAVTYILGMFLENDKIILTEDYNSKKENKILKSGDYHSNDSLINIFNDNLQLGILVDEGSASASEILAGVLLDYQKAIIFGKNTFGKGTVQELLPMAGGSALKVTIAKWILPGGSWISHKGISPDIEIDISNEELEKNRENGTFHSEIDSQLEKAIKDLAKYKNKDEFKEAVKNFSKIRQEKKETEKKDKLEELKKKLQND